MKPSDTSTVDEEGVLETMGLVRDFLHGLLLDSFPAWRDLQLTVPQLRALFTVAHNRTSSVIQIARHLGIGEPTASHLVDRLVQSGFVDRREDPEDRRRALVQLSTEGEGLIGRLLGWEDRVMGTRLRGISRPDLASLRRGLGAIKSSADRGRTPEGSRPKAGGTHRGR